MKNNTGSEEGAVARPAGVGGRADFCSSATAELQGCNECRKCRSIFLPCVALIHAIPGVMQNLHSRHPWRSRRRRAYTDVFTQHLNSIAHWLWLTILDNLGAGFTASCRASDRTLATSRTFICQAFMNVTFHDCPVSFSTACRFSACVRALLQCRVA